MKNEKQKQPSAPSADEDQSAHPAQHNQPLVDIALRHLEAAGITPHPGLAQARGEGSVADYLARSIRPTLENNPQAPWLRPLFSDLVMALQSTYRDNPRLAIAEFFQPFLFGVSDLRLERIAALLPPQASSALGLLAIWEADRQRRIDESGY